VVEIENIFLVRQTNSKARNILLNIKVAIIRKQHG
jgi:hypothetical protein